MKTSKGPNKVGKSYWKICLLVLKNIFDDDLIEVSELQKKIPPRRNLQSLETSIIDSKHVQKKRANEIISQKYR